MSRSKKRKRKNNPKRSGPHRPPPEQQCLPLAVHNFLRSLGRMLASTVQPGWHAVVSISVIVGLAVAIVAIWPRVSIDPGSASDPSDPFTATFAVSNKGNIPLYIASVDFVLCWMTTNANANIAGPNHKNCNRPGPPGWDIPNEWKNHPLGIDDAWTIALSDKVHNPDPTRRFKMTSVDGIFVVSYGPKYLPPWWEKQFRFTTKQQPDGQLQWFHTPIDEE